MTLAAQLLTLPVILYHFQRLSISSLLANPLIQSLKANDYELFLSTSVFILILQLVGNLLADIAYGLLDPRIRYG